MLQNSINFTWPILWARSSAWIRSPGVHESSAKITVLAAVKVNPTPPALIDSCMIIFKRWISDFNHRITPEMSIPKFSVQLIFFLFCFVLQSNFQQNSVRLHKNILYKLSKLLYHCCLDRIFFLKVSNISLPRHCRDTSINSNATHFFLLEIWKFL